MAGTWGTVVESLASFLHFTGTSVREGLDVIEIFLKWKDNIPGKHCSLKSISKSSWGKIGMMESASLHTSTVGSGLWCSQMTAEVGCCISYLGKWREVRDCTMGRKEKCSEEMLKQRFKQYNSGRWLGKPTGRWASSIHKNQESCGALEAWFKANFSVVKPEKKMKKFWLLITCGGWHKHKEGNILSLVVHVAVSLWTHRKVLCGLGSSKINHGMHLFPI